MRRTLLLALAALFVGACADAPTAPESPSTPDAVQLATETAPESRVIPDQYIVVFDRSVRDVPERARGLTARAGGDLLFTYEHALRGFAARLPEAAVEGLRRNPAVAYVEPDGVVTAIGSGTQSAPPSWGLDRVDERDLPMDGQYGYGASGDAVYAYILDTGIRTSHDDFGGRAIVGTDVIGDGGNGQDCNGHGTHVAGTVGGTSYGVAKTSVLVAVRVLDCNGSGSYSGVIAGIDWVTANAPKPAVANMSLGGSASTSVDEAVDNSVAAGVFYAVAAGNGHWLFGWPEDACTKSPAGASRAFTVGATKSDDDEASFSNYGTCVNLLAPGVGITSAWIGSDTDTRTISGTSMATPHVAGAAAAYLEANSGASIDQVADALSANASAGRIALHSSSSSGGTPNLLLYTAFLGDGGGNGPPTASFTSDCTDLACSFDGVGSSDSDGSITSYDWEFGDGATGTGVNSSHTYASGGTYTVTLTVTDDGGATGTTSTEVSVVDPSNSAPTSSLGVPSCTDLTCDFDGSGSSDSDGSIASYDWDYGDGSTGTGETASHTYSSGGTYTVTLTVTDDDGATGTASTDVSVESGPNSPPNAAFEHVCSDLSCAFDGGYSTDEDGTIVSYEWDYGDGTGESGSLVSTTYAEPGTYRVTLTVTDNDGATDEAFVDVTLGGNAAPTASFTPTCTDLDCTFDGSASSDSDGSIESYDWDFGDGNTGSGATASHSYGSAATYTVTLTVTDDGGATGVSSQDVTVEEAPNSAPTASFTKTCTDLACDFDGTGSSDSDGTITSHDWDFGDGNTGTGVTVSHSYGAAATYTVTLTVTDDGGATGVSSQDVSVTEPPAGSIELSATGNKVKGRHTVDLSWLGATSTNVDVERDGVILTTTANDGAFTDQTENRGKGSYTYRVCEAGTDTCSNEVTVEF